MAAAPSERKLTAVVVADIVGYSRLTARDEEGTIARLRELRSAMWTLRSATTAVASSKHWETDSSLSFQASSTQCDPHWKYSIA